MKNNGNVNTILIYDCLKKLILKVQLNRQYVNNRRLNLKSFGIRGRSDLRVSS